MAKNLLANRTQRVMCKNIFSSTAPIHAVVLQGSVLGPLLFLINVNAVTRFCILFTDDNCLQYSSKYVKTFENCLNHIIFTFSVYFYLCLHWKSSMFNFLYFAYSCAMSTNTNVFKCFEYIYFCKIK